MVDLRQQGSLAMAPQVEAQNEGSHDGADTQAGAPLKRVHLDEAAVNYNTLHMPYRLLELDATVSLQQAAARASATTAVREVVVAGDTESPEAREATSDDLNGGVEPYTTLVTLFKPSLSASLGIVLCGDAPQPPIVSEVRPSGIAAGAAARGDIMLGMELVSVNGREVRGHEEGSSAFMELHGHIVLQMRTPAGATSQAAYRRLHQETRRLVALLRGLLERNALQRLCEHQKVAAHAFFADVEWVLLAAHKLPAPFTPDPRLVYAKDHIPPLSVDGAGKKRSTEGARAPNDLQELAMINEASGGWSYVCDAKEYALEVGEYVRKSTTQQLIARARRGVRQSKDEPSANSAKEDCISCVDDETSDEEGVRYPSGGTNGTRHLSSPAVHPDSAQREL